MNGFYDTLQELLAQEKALYEQAVKLSRDKKEAVLGNKVAELDLLVRSEQKLISDLQAAEQRRMVSIHEFTAKLGIDPAAVTLAAMVESAPESRRKPLAEVHGALRETLETLLALNDENRVLVEAQLQYTRYMLSVLTEEDATHTYSSHRGEKEKSKEPPQRTMDFSV
jgi:flagellar biosynthesis/type III secretory pathway chaperone